MDVLLAGRSSLRLTRIARADESLRLVPCGSLPDVAGLRASDLQAIGAALPAAFGPLGRENKVELDFFSREARPRLDCVNAHAILSDLPSEALCEVVPSRGNVRMFVEGPAIALVRMAQSLTSYLKRGALTPQAALVRVTALASELCGTYSRDPDDPAEGQINWGTTPLCDTAELRRVANALTGMKGLRLARRAAGYAAPCSGSPTETLLALAMMLPPEMGGVAFPAFRQNEQVEWPAGAGSLLHHNTMRPDFFWPRHRVAIEYNGKVHDDEENAEEDHFRRQDYATCGISVLEARASDVCDAASLERFLRLVALKLAACEGPGFVAEVEKRLLAEGARGGRATLISQVLVLGKRPAASAEAGT